MDSCCCHNRSICGVTQTGKTSRIGRDFKAQRKQMKDGADLQVIEEFDNGHLQTKLALA